MRGCVRKAAAFFLSFFMVLAGCGMGTCVQAETPRRTVKFAYYYDGDFMYKNDAGEYMGYDVEYLYELSKYAGWEYQFVEYDSFESALAGVENGEADIIPALFKTEERQQKLLFSAKNMGSIYVTLIVPLDDTSHSYNDYASFDGQKIGILAGSEDGESFRRLAAEKNIQADIIEMHSSDELLKALDDGTLDAVAITYLGNSSQYRTVSEFSPMEMYFGMVIISAGVRARVDLAKAAGLAVGRGVTVNAKMETSEPDVYACGDCAEYNGTDYALWSQAKEEGTVAGSNASGGQAQYSGAPAALMFFGLETQLYAAGDNGSDPKKQYKTLEVYDEAGKIYRKCYFLEDHLCGILQIGTLAKVKELGKALEAKASFHDAAVLLNE